MSLPTWEDDRKLLGTISMRTVCLYADATENPLTDIRVREVFEPETIVCIADDRALDVMRRRGKSSHWSVPVIDRNHALIGMVRFQALQDDVEGDSGQLRIDEAGSEAAPSRADRGIDAEEVRRLYEDQGEVAAQNHCIDGRLIATICMSCTRLFRVVDSRGSTGGLSHGWCSVRCAERGAAWAGVDVTLPSP